MDAAPGEARGDVIPMYDELIKRLRETSVDFGESDHVSVMMIEAANAIEELSNIQIAPEKIIQTMWIPVTERLPEKDQEVLIFLFGEDPYIAWHNGEYWCTEDFRLDEPDDWQPTYWFPLPKQPESEGE